MAHPPRIPVWLAWDQPVIWFLTICEESRQRVWDNADFFEAFSGAAEKVEERGLWLSNAAIVMPDHLHLLASPLQHRDQKVGNLSGALKRWTSEALPAHQWDWQPGCFDRLLRHEESAEDKWRYIRENPVRAGLVQEWEEWPWSIGFRESL